MAASSSSSAGAGAALKTQPLHNFELHDLKWALNQTNNQRLRKLSDSSQKSPQVSVADSESESNRKKVKVRGAGPSNNGASSDSSPGHGTGKSVKKVTSGSGFVVDKNKGASSGSSLGHETEKPEKKVTGGSGFVADKGTPSEGRSKIYIRFRTKNQKPAEEVPEIEDQNLNVEDAEEFVPKTWNLRPRKPMSKPPNPNGGALKIVDSPHENKTQKPESSRSRNATEPKAAEKKKNVQKPKFSLTLTREEIEDDIFAMTGSKPSRRPKRRPKNVQKQLDSLYPGMWLSSITPESYKVPDPHTKG